MVEVQVRTEPCAMLPVLETRACRDCFSTRTAGDLVVDGRPDREVNEAMLPLRSGFDNSRERVRETSSQ